MSNLLSYCGLTDGRMRASEKDLPLQILKSKKCSHMIFIFPNSASSQKISQLKKKLFHAKNYYQFNIIKCLREPIILGKRKFAYLQDQRRHIDKKSGGLVVIWRA